MRESKYGFIIPDYGEEADIPSLVAQQVNVLEALLDKINVQFVDGQNGVYFGDTEPEADTYTWFAPIDAELRSEKVLELKEYTGEEGKLHIETEGGKLYTAENTTVNNSGEETVVIIQ